MQTILQNDILSTIHRIFSDLLEKYSSFDKNIIYMLHQKMCKIFSGNQKEHIGICGSAFAWGMLPSMWVPWRCHGPLTIKTEGRRKVSQFFGGISWASSTPLCSNQGVLLPEYLPGKTPWMLGEKIVLKPGRELRPHQGSAKPMLEANPGTQISLIFLKPSFSHTETVHFILLWSSWKPVKYMISLIQDLGELLLLSIIRMYLL